MLDEVSPEQFDEWVAFDRIESDPTLRLIEVVKRSTATLAMAQGMKINPEDLDPVKPERAAAAMSADQAVDVLKAQYGA